MCDKKVQRTIFKSMQSSLQRRIFMLSYWNTWFCIRRLSLSLGQWRKICIFIGCARSWKKTILAIQNNKLKYHEAILATSKIHTLLSLTEYFKSWYFSSINIKIIFVQNKKDLYYYTNFTKNLSIKAYKESSRLSDKSLVLDFKCV